MGETSPPQHKIDADELLGAAVEQTGLSDYGDHGFVEALHRLVDAVATEGDLTPMGFEGFKMDTVRLLSNKLRMVAALSEHPEILDEDVSDPIVVTGIPRTGTTKLQKAIACNPGVQSLPLWRALNPAPMAPPGTDPDPRIAIADMMADQLAQHFPDFMAGHPMLTHDPEEEALLMQLSFDTVANGWFHHVPSYTESIRARRPTAAHEELHRWLQYLQWQDGGRRGRPWVLKTPIHLGDLDRVLESFPRATVVHCHRDPVEAIPSVCRLIEVVRGSRGTDPIDLDELGQFFIGECSRMWTDNLAQRSGFPESQIVDIDYRTIRDDIGSVLDLIWDTRGEELDEDARKAMLGWQDANPQHRFGRHVYSLERYGLDAGEISAAMEPYLHRFPAGTVG